MDGPVPVPVGQALLPANPGDLCQRWQALRHAQRLLVAARRTWTRRVRARRTRLREEAAALVQQRHELERRRREVDSEAELSRRQLNGAWQRFRREERHWQELQRRQVAALQDQQFLVTQRVDELQTAEAQTRRLCDDLAQSQSTHERELQGLENRVRHARQHLLRLQNEAARLEQVPLAAAVPAAMPAAVTSLPLLDEIGTVIQELLDQNRRLDEHQDQLVRLREAWQIEWDRAIVTLAERERDVQEQEHRLANDQQAQRRWSEMLRHQADELAVRQRQYRAWEARLLHQRSSLRSEEVQSDAVRVQTTQAARRRQRRATRLLAKATVRHRRLLELHARLRDQLGAVAVHWDERGNELSRRAAALEQRERELALWELVLCQAKDQLLALDTRPAAAEHELQRRARLAKQLAERPLARLRDKEAELESLHEELAMFRDSLIADQRRLLQQEHDLEHGQARLDRDRLQFALERDHANQELVLVRTERDRLQEHVRELNEQLDRLTLLLMDETPPGPHLAVAA